MKHGAPVLLVEDDEVDIMTVRRAFSRGGVANPLHVARNGEEALAFLRNLPPFGDPAAHPMPGIILLDINMPIMSGTEFLRELKADPALRAIPVIVLTTSVEERDRMESFRLGVAGYIVKPVGFDEFVRAITVIRDYWYLNELFREGGET
jgi:CheY-like chemotaxis protein